MQEIHRAFIVVLLIAVFVYGFAKKPLTDAAIAPADFVRRRNLWLALTAALFLVPSFWMFMTLAGALLLIAARHDSNTVALLFATVLAVPLIGANIDAFGIINYLFELDFLRLFSLLVLLPAYLHLRSQPTSAAVGSTVADRFFLGFLVLCFGMEFTASTFTNALRSGFYLLLEVFLPYYVASRCLKSMPSFRDALSTYVLVAAVLGVIGVFEFGKGWLLYSNVSSALDAPWGMGQYLNRGESLRALATTGQPIVLGFVLALCFCFYLFVRESIASPVLRAVGLIGIMGTLVSPLSRGPWVGAVAGYLVFLALSPKGLGTLAKRVLLGVGLFLLALASPIGDSIIAVLPFVGNVDAQNVTYRQDLLTNSLIVIARNPWLGSLNFIQAPEMEALRWGGDEGIIDIVNSYVAVALSYGLLGLGLFVGFMLSVMWGVYKSMKVAAALDGSMEMLGRTLLATMVCIAITIYTVSSISYISVLTWLVFGLGASYQAMVSRTGVRLDEAAPLPVIPPRPRALPRRPQPVAKPQPVLDEVTQQVPLNMDATQQMPLYQEPTQKVPLRQDSTQPAPLLDEATQRAPFYDEATQQVPLQEATQLLPLADDPTQQAPLRK